MNTKTLSNVDSFEIGDIGFRSEKMLSHYLCSNQSIPTVETCLSRDAGLETWLKLRLTVPGPLVSLKRWTFDF